MILFIIYLIGVLASGILLIFIEARHVLTGHDLILREVISAIIVALMSWIGFFISAKAIIDAYQNKIIIKGKKKDETTSAKLSDH